MVETVHKDAIRKAGGVNDRRVGTGANERERFANDDVLLIGAGRNVDRVIA